MMMLTSRNIARDMISNAISRFLRTAAKNGVVTRPSSAPIKTFSSTLSGASIHTTASLPGNFQQYAIRCYSTTDMCCKIHGFGSDGDGKELSQDEMKAIVEGEEARMKAEEEAKTYPNWKAGQRKRQLLKTYSEEEFERFLMPDKFVDNPIWTLRDKRCGAIAIKVGMMPVWDDWGVRHACTVLWLDRNIVLGHKTVEKHGYSAIQVAAGERKFKNVGKCVLGQYQAAEQLSSSPPYLVREFRITDEANLLPLYSTIHARHFVPGQNIDVSGISKGKGFQGAMKRHGFRGMPASHGTSRSHRSLGSTGNCQDPGKVFKGKKMAGRMGADRVTVQNLRIVKVDRGRDLIYVAGHIPGQKGNFVELRDAVKNPLWRTDKVRGSLDRPPLPTFEYDPSIDGSGTCHEEFMPVGDEDPLDPDYMDTTVVIKAQA
jgi:large subunit ribosomal protein L3